MYHIEKHILFVTLKKDDRGIVDTGSRPHLKAYIPNRSQKKYKNANNRFYTKFDFTTRDRD